MSHQPPAPYALSAPFDDLLVVRSGDKGAVYVKADVWNGILAVFGTNPREEGLMRRCFERWCDGHRLTPEQLANEGSFHDGRATGKEWRVWALKAFQLRLYGVEVTLISRPKCFVGLNFDVKKRDKANKAILEATARRAGVMMARGVK